MTLRHSSGFPQCNQVTRMPLAKLALLCKQTIDNIRTRPAPWRHLSSSCILFVPHCSAHEKFGDLVKTPAMTFFNDCCVVCLCCRSADGQHHLVANIITICIPPNIGLFWTFL